MNVMNRSAICTLPLAIQNGIARSALNELPVARGYANVNPNCTHTLDLLAQALALMDAEELHHVAARIAMAIDDLAKDPACAEPTTFN